MTDSIIRVVAAVIRNQNCVLIAQRPDHKRHGGLWEFPGGKIQEGESVFGAVKRELEEELGVDVTETGEILYSDQDNGSPFVIEFVETQILGDPKPLEHLDLKWANLADLESMQLAPTDARFLAKYLLYQ